jgi:hypothetical protein
MRDSCAAARHLTADAADQPPLPFHAPRMQPPALHLTPSPLVRKRSRSLLSPQLPSSSCHSTRARHRHRAPATIDRRLWCSSSPIDPLVASPELEVALHPHQSRQPTPTDHLTGVPLRPTTHRRRATAMVSLPPPFTPNRSHHHPGSLPGYFPADQRRPAGRIRPVSRRRRGGGGISLPCFLGWAKSPRKPGRLAEQAEAPLWVEPKYTVHFLNYFSNSFELIQINSEFD